MNTSDVVKGVLAIVIASFLWGTTGTAAQFAPEISPLAIGAFAMGIGGVLLCICARKSLVKDAPILFSTPLTFLFGSACVAIYPLAFYSSMRLSGVAIGTVVSIASAPLFAALLEYFLSKKPVSLKWFISFVFGAFGIGMLAMGKAHDAMALSVSKDDQVFGVLLGLIAGLTYAGYYGLRSNTLTLAQIQNRHGRTFRLRCSCSVAFPLVYRQNMFANTIHISVSLYMAVVPMFLGYLLFGYGLCTTEASKAALITLSHWLRHFSLFF